MTEARRRAFSNARAVLKIVSSFGVVGALALVALGAVPSHASASRTAYYTATQASAGAKAYAADCASCHGVHLEGVSAPALVGGGGMAASESVADLYGFITEQMPAGNPGSLSSATYTSILAFLLEKNGHPAGAVPLTPARIKTISESL